MHREHTSQSQMVVVALAGLVVLLVSCGGTDPSGGPLDVVATHVPSTLTPQAAATPTPTPTAVVEDGGPMAVCGYGPLYVQVPTEKHFLAWLGDDHIVFDDFIAIKVFNTVDGRVSRIALLNRGPYYPKVGVFGSVDQKTRQLVYVTCLYSDELFYPWNPYWPEDISEQDASDLPEYDLTPLYEMVLVQLDGVEDDEVYGERITLNKELEHYPVWHPEGSSIAYITAERQIAEVGFSPNKTVVSVVEDSGKGRTAAIAGSVRGVAMAPPQWSPDGKYIAFLSNEGEAFQYSGGGLPPDRQFAHIIEVETQATTRIGIATGIPSWNPTGDAIAFGGRESGRPVVYITDTEGNVNSVIKHDFQVLGKEALSVSQLAWSPDGKYIAIIVEHGRWDAVGSAIYIWEETANEVWEIAPEDAYRFDGAEKHEVDRGASPRLSYRIAWSPDGGRLAIRGDLQGYAPITPRSGVESTLMLLVVVGPNGEGWQVLVDRWWGP